jgi:hypothetical protein
MSTNNEKFKVAVNIIMNMCPSDIGLKCECNITKKNFKICNDCWNKAIGKKKEGE